MCYLLVTLKSQLLFIYPIIEKQAQKQVQVINNVCILITKNTTGSVYKEKCLLINIFQSCYLKSPD